MIRKIFVEAVTGNMTIAFEPPGACWRLAGYVGDGENGSPFGVLAANVCTTCGTPQEPLPSGQLMCPRGHGRLATPQAWNANPLFDSLEVALPASLPYYNARQRGIVFPGYASFPLETVRRPRCHKGTAEVATDFCTPVEGLMARWQPPGPWEACGDGGCTEIQWAPARLIPRMYRAIVVFHRLPTHELPQAAGIWFGNLVVDAPPGFRLDWMAAEADGSAR